MVRPGDAEAAGLWDSFQINIMNSSVSISNAFEQSCFIDAANPNNSYMSFFRVLDVEVVYD